MTAHVPFTPLTKQAVADSLGISIRTIENWINEGILPAPTRLGGRVYWHPDVYYSWLSRRLKEEPVVEPTFEVVEKPEPTRRACASADKTAAGLRASTERKLARLQGLT